MPRWAFLLLAIPGLTLLIGVVIAFLFTGGRLRKANELPKSTGEEETISADDRPSA